MEKKPFLTESMAQDIIQDVPTPFHVYDEKGIRENARRINKAFSWNKGFREYFAVKALPNPVILQILKEEGCGVDCSSLTELMLSEVCGFSGSDIMFSSNQTPVEDMKKAYELGAYINLDDATMVDFLDRVAGVPENIFCRYNPGGTFQLGESKEGFQVMDKPGDAKYGMTEEQMIDSYKKLAAKGAKNFGIHAFLASNTISDAYYPELAGILFQLAVRVQKATGVHIAYINLFGGVGIIVKHKNFSIFRQEITIEIPGGFRIKNQEFMPVGGIGIRRIGGIGGGGVGRIWLLAEISVEKVGNGCGKGVIRVCFTRKNGMVVRQNLIRILLFGFLLEESAADFLNRFSRLSGIGGAGVFCNGLCLFFLTFRFGNLILLIGICFLRKRFRRNSFHCSSRFIQHTILKFEDFDFLSLSHNFCSFLLDFSEL